MSSDQHIREYTTEPRTLGEQYTITYGNGVELTYLVTLLEPCSLFGEEGGWKQDSTLISKTEPPDPKTLPCAVCDKPIAAADWEWAAMPDNGPVHLSCFMTDDELRAQIQGDREPCTGCDTLCDKYQSECIQPDVLYYGDGINNCTIYRDG